MTVTSVPLINYRNNVNKSGLYNIHLRVTIARVQRYYLVKVPQKVKLTQWSGEFDSWVKNSHPYAFEINNKIIETRAIITDLVKRFYNHNKPMNFYAVERELMRLGDRMVFNDYVKNYIRHPPENVILDDVTWEKYKAFLKHLNNFQPKIMISQIDGTMVARFKNYLAGLKGRKGKMNPSTIKSYFDKFKVILTYAAKKDNLLDKNEVEAAFEDVKIKIPKRKEGLHLEIEEIQKLKKLVFNKTDFALERDRNLFLFQVYTGLYYSDLQELKKDQLFTDHEYGYYIIGERDKNGNPNIIPLFKFPYANTILEKYRSLSPEVEFLFKRNCFIEVQAYNRNLKKLAIKCGISRALSNKTGRHTNAQMWIRFGAERSILSKMMGHEKEETTGNYYKVTLKDIIEGTKSVNFDKLAI